MTPISCRSAGEELHCIEKLLGYIWVERSFAEASIRNFLLFANSSTSLPCRKWLCLKVSHREQAMFTPSHASLPISLVLVYPIRHDLSHVTLLLLLFPSIFKYIPASKATNGCHFTRTPQPPWCIFVCWFSTLDYYICENAFIILSVAIYFMLCKNAFVWTVNLSRHFSHRNHPKSDGHDGNGWILPVRLRLFRGTWNNFVNTANNKCCFHTVDK